eukprot:1151182-Pelagomonas_calceolata.AAC.4
MEPTRLLTEAAAGDEVVALSLKHERGLPPDKEGGCSRAEDENTSEQTQEVEAGVQGRGEEDEEQKTQRRDADYKPSRLKGGGAQARAGAGVDALATTIKVAYSRRT